MPNWTANGSWWLLYLSGGGIGLCGIAAIISRQITQPIGALALAANQMGQGALGVRAPVFAKDEVGVAAQAFNSMAASLDDLLRLLEQSQQRTAHWKLRQASEMAEV